MADIDCDSGLPIRSESDGSDQRVHVKIYDGTTSPSVNAVEVDSDNNLHMEIHGNNPAGADVVGLHSELGHYAIDGIYSASDNSDPSNIGLIAHVRNAAPGDEHQINRVTSIQNGTVIALDVSLHDGAGLAFSDSNPLPVSFINPDDLHDLVHDFQRTDDVARNASATHEYTVTAGKLLHLKQWKAVGSGKIRAELQVETGVGTDEWDTVDIDYNSTSFPSQETAFSHDINVAAGVKVRVVILNRDYCNFDVFSWINGWEEDV